ncbi:hypothetical protein NFI96_008784 [Prochilodus magdalenae]|nr:hypothetical protein NFI96_008784 [Prochilodus magdalenae]
MKYTCGTLYLRAVLQTSVAQSLSDSAGNLVSQGIPQLVFMTRVDQACPRTQKDLKEIYRSKKIKEKMEQCSIRLGVPVNCIFPVKNYHDEIKIDKNLNCLMLQGLTQAAYSAHDYVKKSLPKHKAEYVLCSRRVLLGEYVLCSRRVRFVFCYYFCVVGEYVLCS